jgi:hypothetical protein
MNTTMVVTQSGDVERVLDANNADRLVARRLEVFFEPRDDDLPSTAGKIIWHTEWEHRSGDFKRGVSLGPRIERSIEQILGEDFTFGLPDAIPGLLLVLGVKSAFVHHAAAQFGIELPGASAAT